jgi:hypothetical protein
VQTGSGRAPLIIAIVAALITYVALGHQTPFSFLHHLGHPKITINTDKTADAAEDARQAALDKIQDAADRAQAEADRAQEQADRKQELRERAEELKQRAQELSEQAKELAQAGVEKAAAAIPPVPAIPAPPAIPALPAIPAPPAAPAPSADTEVRTLEPFDSITIENGADTTVTIGDTQSVTLTGGMGHAETRVHDGKLTVSGLLPGVRVAIIVPHLHTLQVNGYGKVSLVGLRDPITIKANGAVQLWGSGAVESANLVMNGPSKFQLEKLEAKNLTVQVNGVGDADVYATENLTADVKGVGHIRYRGDPHLVTKINGPGTVQRVAAS